MLKVNNRLNSWSVLSINATIRESLKHSNPVRLSALFVRAHAGNTAVLSIWISRARLSASRHTRKREVDDSTPEGAGSYQTEPTKPSHEKRQFTPLLLLCHYQFNLSSSHSRFLSLPLSYEDMFKRDLSIREL